ncbi:hypothetical protein D3C72_1023760 [compost metagenome]
MYCKAGIGEGHRRDHICSHHLTVHSFIDAHIHSNITIGQEGIQPIGSGNFTALPCTSFLNEIGHEGTKVDIIAEQVQVHGSLTGYFHKAFQEIFRDPVNRDIAVLRKDLHFIQQQIRSVKSQAGIAIMEFKVTGIIDKVEVLQINTTIYFIRDQGIRK